MKTSSIFFKLIFCLTFLSLAGCYHFPGEDEYSLVPTTNNRAITREKDTFAPGVSY